jgi:glycosyltransferase involved in cell wall biosynthesis
MKILHVIGYFADRYGGPPKACLDTAIATASAGHEVSIYTTNQDGSANLNVPLDRSVWQNGVEIRYFQIHPPQFWGTSVPLAIALRAAIPKVDIVHIHSLYLFHEVVAAYFCRQFCVPYVISPHGSLNPFIYNHHRFRKSIIEFLVDHNNIKNSGAMHFTTDDEKLLAMPYIDNANSFVVPLGLNLNEYADLPALGTWRSQHPNLEHKKIILFFGRINFKKGLDILVQAFAQVAKVRQDVHLVITGPDNEGYSHKVKEWLHQAGITELATFTGMLQGRDKLAILSDADLFLLPSYTENFGIAVVEAMVCGLPVIISDQVNIWREVVTGGAGRACPCDPDCFAKTILELLDHQDMMTEMGENGKELVKRSFNWKMITKSLEQEYMKIIGCAKIQN